MQNMQFSCGWNYCDNELHRWLDACNMWWLPAAHQLRCHLIRVCLVPGVIERPSWPVFGFCCSPEPTDASCTSLPIPSLPIRLFENAPWIHWINKIESEMHQHSLKTATVRQNHSSKFNRKLIIDNRMTFDFISFWAFLRLFNHNQHRNEMQFHVMSPRLW